jgi:hypothetical protein
MLQRLAMSLSTSSCTACELHIASHRSCMRLLQYLDVLTPDYQSLSSSQMLSSDRNCCYICLYVLVSHYLRLIDCTQTSCGFTAQPLPQAAFFPLRPPPPLLFFFNQHRKHSPCLSKLPVSSLCFFSERASSTKLYLRHRR